MSIRIMLDDQTSKGPQTPVMSFVIDQGQKRGIGGFQARFTGGKRTFDHFLVRPKHNRDESMGVCGVWAQLGIRRVSKSHTAAARL
jgi:hypothetical protein